jgi:hypothetical protein
MDRFLTALQQAAFEPMFAFLADVLLPGPAEWAAAQVHRIGPVGLEENHLGLGLDRSGLDFDPPSLRFTTPSWEP